MKLTATILVLAAVAGARPRNPQSTLPGHTLTAYFVDARTHGRDLSGTARQLAAQMFAAVGVKLQWRFGQPAATPKPADMVVVVTLADRTSNDFKPGTLALAQPYEGIHLTVFYDRVTALEPGCPNVLLAHVMVHEIAHLLEGFSRHSEAGVLKAHFARPDVTGMRGKPLPFTPDDVMLMNLGIARRLGIATAYLASSATVSR